jgi:hypothetical protein
MHNGRMLLHTKSARFFYAETAAEALDRCWPYLPYSDRLNLLIHHLAGNASSFCMDWPAHPLP